MAKSAALATFLLLANIPLCAPLPESKPAMGKGDKETHCDDGWVFSRGFCYYFSEPEDTARFEDAIHQCLLLDAELTRPEMKTELEFLQHEARSRTTYGWLLNLLENTRYDLTMPVSYSAHNVKTNKDEPVTQVEGSVPELQPSFGKSWKDNTGKCVGLYLESYSYSYLSYAGAMAIMSCDLRLRFACQGRQSNFADQTIDYQSWFQRGSNVFWVSSEPLSRENAKAACKAKSMGLVTSPRDFMASLNITVDSTPWWTAQVVGDTQVTYEDGSPVDAKDMHRFESTADYLGGVIALLHSGKSIRKALYNINLPYICKKRAHENTKYGCSNLWYRAGRSCYHINSGGRQSWEKAKGKCEDLGAHLITVNSKDESLWLQSIYSMAHFYFIWSSANDRDLEGTFTWHDGSAMDTNIFPWMSGSESFANYHSAGENCMLWNVGTSTLSTAFCKASYGSVGCQYDLPASASRCKDNWKEFEGTCYYFESGTTHWTIVMEGECGYKNEDIHPTRLQIKSEKVKAFLDANANVFTYVWLGIRFNPNHNAWLWDDGTMADFSVFGKSNEPDNGSGDKAENCVATDGRGKAFDKVCDIKYGYICEKELPGDGVRSVGVAGSVPLLCVIVGVITRHCLQV